MKSFFFTIIPLPDPAYLSLVEERDSAQGQVDFLNSIIVDMQRKNDELKARVELLETGISSADVDELEL